MKRLLLVVTLLAAGASQAAGFSITTHSARATGMGTAVTAHLDDATSMAYNPAGLAGVKGLQVLVGDTPILPHVVFTPAGGGPSQDTEFWIAPPPHLYAAYPLMDNLVAGISLYTPFGNQIRWSDDFVGRFISQQAQLATFDINPTVAYAPVEWLRVGAGLQLLYSTVDLRRSIPIALPTGLTEGQVKLTGDDLGVGFDVGFQVTVLRDFLYFGATYRSRIDLGLEGDAEFSNIPEPARPLLANQSVSADVTLPSTLSLGVAVKPLKRLTVALDATWWEWSRFEELAIEFENPLLSEASRLPKNWHVRWNVHLGAEYGLTDVLTVRGGLGYDPTPIPEETLSPDLPDLSRLVGFLGLGVDIGRFQVGAGYEFLLLQEKTSTFPPLPGTYDGTAHVLSVTVGYLVR